MVLVKIVKISFNNQPSSTKPYTRLSKIIFTSYTFEVTHYMNIKKPVS